MIKQVLHTLQDVTQFVQTLDKLFAFDVETTGLDYYTDYVIGLSLCDGKQACYIDLEDNSDREPILSLLMPLFMQSKLVAHNMSFDMKMLKKEDFHFSKQIFCTFIAAYLLDENRASHHLKDLARWDLGIKNTVTYEQAIKKGTKSKEFYEYGMNDSIWTFGLFQKYRKMLKESGLEHIFYDVEMRFVPIQVQMEIFGVQVDLDKCIDLRTRGRKVSDSLKIQMCNLIGEEPQIQTSLLEDSDEIVTTTNFDSPQQVGRLIEKLGVDLPIVKKKKTTESKHLEKIKSKHKFIELLLEYRKVQKLLSTYILPTWDRVDQDNRMRPSFGIAVTGRLTCSDPNLQNLPRINKDLNLNYREIFCAKKNYLLTVSDYSGQEVNWLTLVSKDSNLIEAARKRQDVHLKTANWIYKLNLSSDQLCKDNPDYEEIKKKYAKERYRAKNGTVFPIVYGRTVYGISAAMGISRQEAQRQLNEFFELYPRVKESMRETEEELSRNGQVMTAFGRIRRFPHYYKANKWEKAAMLRQAFNFKMQGSSADQVKIASYHIKECHKAYPQWNARIILEVHDEIVSEVKKEYAKEEAAAKAHIMQHCLSLPIEFEVETKIGRYYGDLK